LENEVLVFQDSLKSASARLIYKLTLGN